MGYQLDIIVILAKKTRGQAKKPVRSRPKVVQNDKHDIPLAAGEQTQNWFPGFLRIRLS